MTKASQRFLSLLLAAILLVGLFPVSALAAETETSGITEPEVSSTDPPSTVAAEAPTDGMEATVPETTTPAETEPMETTVPVTEPEPTHGEETQPEETVPETTHGEDYPPQSEETESATSTVPNDSFSVLDDLNINVDSPGISTMATATGSQCLVLCRVWNNVQEIDPVTGTKNNTIRYEYPAGKARARSFVDLHVLKVNDSWKTAYCMEPGIATSTGATYTTETMNMEQLLNSGLLSDDLTKDKVEAMGLIALYGQQKRPGQTDLNAIGKMTATQILMWEIAIGWRNPNPNYTRTNDAFSRRFQDKVSGAGCLFNGSRYWSGDPTGYITNIQTAYNEIAAKVEKHFVVPSFSSLVEGTAPTILLLPDGNGKYTATVTDTNGILSEYTLPSMAGVTFTKNGNKLTITTTKEFDATLVAPTKTVPNFEDQSYYYWHDGDAQTLISCAAEPSYDPIPAYFKIQSKPDEGTGKIKKVSTNGGTVAGWRFTIWRAEVGQSWQWIGSYATNANGEINVTLEPGRYVVREQALSTYANSGFALPTGVDPEYWECDTSDHVINIVANQTTTLTVANNLLGKIKVQKTTNTGGDLAGWIFEVRNSSGTVVATLTTDSNGSATSELLEPGNYTVKEIGGPDGVWGSEEWFFDVTTSGGVVVSNRNLFDNASINGTSRWSGSNKTGVSAVTYDGKNCLKVDPSAGTSTLGFGAQLNIQNIGAGKYTVSADIYVDTDRSVYIQAWTGSSWSGIGSKTISCKAGWNHIEHTFNFTQDYDSIHVGFGGLQSMSAFYVYHPMLERGSYATAWTDSYTGRNVTVAAGSTATHEIKNIKGGKIAVQKNTNTGEYLSGWLFEVKDSSGELVTTLKTDDTGYAVTDVLAPGTYTVTEVGNSAEDFDPDLWVMDEVPTHEVEISADTYEEFKTVFYRNAQKGTGTIQKIVLNGGSVAGWDFKITDTDGNTVFEGETNADGLLNFALEAGTYYVYETEDREHYINDAAEYKIVEIVAGEAAEVVTFTNTFVPPPGVAQIVKTSTNGGAVAGWTFIIEDSTGMATEVVTDESGIIAVELEPGSYKVYEKPVSDDYWILDGTVYEFTLESEEVKELPFTNRWIGELKIVKTLLQPDDGTLDGWTFLIEKVVEVDGEITVESSFTAVTDENGLISRFIEPGTYRITEVLEDSIWEPTCENPQIVEIVAGEAKSVAFENRLKPGRIEITKCDFLGTPLSGAKFLLEWSKDGDIWTPVFRNDTNTLVQGGCSSTDLIDGTLVSGDDGIIAFEGLDPRLMYRVTELEAPEGYQLLADYAYVGYLPADTVEIQRTVVNFKLFTMPSVGSIGTTEIITGGMFLTIFAMVLCCALYFSVLSGKTAVKKKYNTKGKNTMKTNINRILSLLMVLCLTITMALPAFAAENAATAIIDTTKTGSITLNKYDMTAATADGVFSTNSFVTTGTVDEAAESILAEYAIQGVIFSYIKVADIVTYSANETGHKTMVLYAFDEGAATTQLLTALGLSAADAYNNVEGEAGKLYFVSDTLIGALAAKLASNSSILKNDLEAFMDDNNATAMPETDANGKSAVTGLELGLYLLVETYVPENVSKTTAPFFTSVPSTTIDGDNWNYDITLYPKNETDAPNLEKTLRESKPDTGKHNGTTHDITDGYAHTGTASDGDVVDYQIISSLPKITSNATALTAYTFADTLSKGIEYNKNDVVIEWYTDAACTDLIASWTEADGKFAVAYGEGENDATTMTITMTDAGLDEINNSTAVYDANSLFRGYSDCTIRITYAATVNSSADVVYGDNGNPNTVTLTWKRTNTSYYDTLTDDCHVFVYALDLTKYFSDGNGDFSNVNFVIYNETDGYWVVAEQDAETGIYYVTDHVSEEADATVFVPISDGKIAVKGIEDDTYIITETATDDGYILLKEAITVVITAAGDGEICAVCGKEGVTATATVDGDAVTMTEDNGSLSAVVNLSVVNTLGYEAPETGDTGTVMLIVCGVLVTVSALCFCIMVLNKKRFV